MYEGISYKSAIPQSRIEKSVPLYFSLLHILHNKQPPQSISHFPNQGSCHAQSFFEISVSECLHRNHTTKRYASALSNWLDEWWKAMTKVPSSHPCMLAAKSLQGLTKLSAHTKRFLVYIYKKSSFLGVMRAFLLLITSSLGSGRLRAFIRTFDYFCYWPARRRAQLSPTRIPGAFAEWEAPSRSQIRHSERLRDLDIGGSPTYHHWAESD